MARPRKQQSKGLGDTVEKFTEATGIKKVVKSIFGDGCGCDERKEKLNNLIPYRRKVNCLNESDYNKLTDYIKPTKGTLTPNEQWEIAAIYERVFEVKIQHSSCSSCWRDTLADLRKVYNEYKPDEV